MKGWKVTIKEIGKERPIVSEHHGNLTRLEVIKFYGSTEPDVEWYRVEPII